MTVFEIEADAKRLDRMAIKMRKDGQIQLALELRTMASKLWQLASEPPAPAGSLCASEQDKCPVTCTIRSHEHGLSEAR